MLSERSRDVRADDAGRAVAKQCLAAARNWDALKDQVRPDFTAEDVSQFEIAGLVFGQFVEVDSRRGLDCFDTGQ